MNQRLARLRQLMEEKGLDAVLVSQPENRRYLSGFTGSSGVLIISGDRALLATDFRYYQQVERQAPGYELVQVTGTMEAALAAQVEKLNPRRVGFESHVLTVETFEGWNQAMPQVEWVATSGLVEGLRQIKDAGEIEAIQEAVRIADDAMGCLVDLIHPGMTEREVAWELEVQMRTHGAEKLSFTTIVASGPNGAMPHAEASERRIEIGDPIVVDLGAVYDGYCSDVTRSFCLIEASEEYLAAWDTVLEAQLAAERGIRAGMSGVEADAIARQIVYDAGYEGKFGHGLGHGVGLEVHEGPRASRTSTDILRAGAIVTVEPGIYIPGWGGIRIEDMVVVTEQGCRLLTQSPKVPVIGAG